MHLDGGLEVLQHEDGHLVALLGELAGQAGDHAADEHDIAPSSRSAASATVHSTLRRSAASTPSSGWSLDVQAEHLLLELQPLALVELDRRGSAMRSSNPAAVGGVVAQVAEQAHHALVALAAAHDAWCR